MNNVNLVKIFRTTITATLIVGSTLCTTWRATQPEAGRPACSTAAVSETRLPCTSSKAASRFSIGELEPFANEARRHPALLATANGP